MTAAELHAQIMNLQANVVSPSLTKSRVFKMGHAQARHAAAELALRQDVAHLSARVTQREQERDAAQADARRFGDAASEQIVRAERAEAALAAMSDAAEMLWIVVANVSGGDWTQQTPEWQEAAARWRDAYFAAFTAIHPVPAPPTGKPT